MKISAIVPVYNSENYVERCINSVLAQTYRDWELILVDDGSEDNSLSILNRYAEQDTRIKVLHQENAGPGMARNTGISNVTGDYIVFVDSDDRISDNYFSLLSEKIEDVVFIDINQVDDNFNILKKEYMSSYRHLSKDSFLRQQMTGKINWGGVRKAVKTELLLDNKIGFSKHQIGEEAIYSFLVLKNAQSFSFIDSSVYEYVNREGSQSDLKVDDPWGCVASALKEKIMEMKLYQQYADTVNAFILTATVVALDKMAHKYDYGSYRQLAKEKIQSMRKEIDLQYSVDKASMDNKARILYPLIKVGWVTPIYLISRLRRLCRSR